ncbi:MAG: acyl-CoA dehydrogenase family protein, partial [bacterium]
MNYFLTEDQKMMKDLARQVAREKMQPVREHYDETEEFPWEIVKEFASTGLSSVPYPKEYGGLGGGNFELVLIVEELCKVCAGIPLALAATFLGALPILISGTDEQKKKFIPPLAKGEKLAAFAITEPEAGSDAGATKTTAVKDGDSYILNGSKIFCTNGGEAEFYSILAMTDRARGHRGGSFFVLEKGMPGFTFGKKEKKLGIRASATRELIFQNCRVPAANRLGREGAGFITALRTLDRSRPGIASQALGIAAGALEDAVAYARQRKQFGQAISSFQAIQHMLADMAMQVEAARALT